MVVTFDIAAIIAIVSTILMVTRLNAVHALLYLVVSLLAVAVIFYVLGAPFVAALEVIIYAGAIMVLFIFVMMMFNLGERAKRMEQSWLTPKGWVGPAILAVILLIELGSSLQRSNAVGTIHTAGPRAVAVALYGPYLLGVELVSMLLLAGIVGAYHLGWSGPGEREPEDAIEPDRERATAGRHLVRAGDGGVADAPQRSVHPHVH